MQVWHAVSRDRKPLRKEYLEAILPPFVAILRRWRPLLAVIHELATADGLNPLKVDGRALAADALPIEVTGMNSAFLFPLYVCSFLCGQSFDSLSQASTFAYCKHACVKHKFTETIHILHLNHSSSYLIIIFFLYCT